MKAAFIFARGGSKGVPFKNIRPLAGKPLIVYSIEVALALDELDKCFVSSDDEEILRIAETCGASAIHRPASLATDTAAEWDAWRHAVDYVETNASKSLELFVSLPATAPLRLTSDIEACIARYYESRADIVVTMSPSIRSPWFNMLKQATGSGRVLPVNSTTGQKISRRQDAPQTFDMTTVAYVTSGDYVMKNSSLWNGDVQGIVVPQERSVDIDTELDFKFAELLMKERLGD